jgi:single-stranded DNA-binding protein
VEDINNTVLVARLTKDPEIKGSVLPLRLAFTTRRKNGDAWEDKPN